MKISPIYRCPICKREHATEEEAITCYNSTPEPNFKVGEIVEAGYGKGWFDGKREWVINPELDPRAKHGFGKDASWGFYYVITAIDNEKHRVRYHLATLAMGGDLGYAGGYTFDKNHITPKGYRTHRTL